MSGVPHSLQSGYLSFNKLFRYLSGTPELLLCGQWPPVVTCGTLFILMSLCVGVQQCRDFQPLHKSHFAVALIPFYKVASCHTSQKKMQNRPNWILGISNGTLGGLHNLLVVPRFSSTPPIPHSIWAAEMLLPHFLSPIVSCQCLRAGTGHLSDISGYIPPIITGIALLDSPS